MLFSKLFGRRGRDSHPTYREAGHRFLIVSEHSGVRVGSYDSEAVAQSVLQRLSRGGHGEYKIITATKFEPIK